MTLQELAKKHNTDKFEHGYMPVYERLFNSRDIKSFLEIGVFEGGSLRMWKEYFPEAKILGVDNNPRGKGELEADATVPFPGMEGPWDVIIDDGSHAFDDIHASFNMLYPYLNKGGLYVVEDIYGSPDTMKAIDYFSNLHKESFGKEFDLELVGQLLIIKKL